MANHSYSISDVDEILMNLNGNKLIFTKHCFKREQSRGISEEYIRKVILNEDPLDIEQDKRNEFKLYYPSENYSNKELVIIIAIDKDKSVIIQSVWESKRIL
ncbi:DUF4258 domain-containing protein [Methanobrevibacter sp.]